jgi:hypothetical protein
MAKMVIFMVNELLSFPTPADFITHYVQSFGPPSILLIKSILGISTTSPTISEAKLAAVLAVASVSSNS